MVLPHEASLVKPVLNTRAMSQCGTGDNTIEYDPFYAYCDPIAGKVHPIVPIPDDVQEQAPAQTAITKRTLAHCGGSGTKLVEYDTELGFCDEASGKAYSISYEQGSAALTPENTLVSLPSMKNFADFESVPREEKREDRLSPGEWA